MKKLRKTLPLIGIILILFSSVCFSHPGRTDENGGHWDRKEGTYHFHTGEYKGRSLSGGSSKSEYIPFTPPYDPPTENPYRNNYEEDADENSDEDNTKATFPFIIFIFPAIGLIYFLIELFCSCFNKPKTDIEKFSNLFCKLDNYTEELLQKEKQREACYAIFIPFLYEIGKDNLPREKECTSHWGKTFTLYKAYNGIKLHAKFNCCNANMPVHIYYYKKYYKALNMCRKCAKKYVVPDMSWYDDCLEYEKLKAECQRIKNNCKDMYKEINALYKKCNSRKTRFLIMFSKKNKELLTEANKKYSKLTKIY